MTDTIEKEVKKLVNDNIASLALVYYLRKATKKVREVVFNKIVYGILGAAFASGIITFIFRKEIEELISDAKNITQESLLRFADKIKKFAKKRKEAHSKK